MHSELFKERGRLNVWVKRLQDWRMVTKGRCETYYVSLIRLSLGSLMASFYTSSGRLDEGRGDGRGLGSEGQRCSVDVVCQWRILGERHVQVSSKAVYSGAYGRLAASSIVGCRSRCRIRYVSWSPSGAKSSLIIHASFVPILAARGLFAIDSVCL